MNKSSGFTLIEVLVTIVILSILAVIALPTYLKFIDKSKETEALSILSTINRLQVENYLSTGSFVKSIDKLGLGLDPKTKNYNYIISNPDNNISAQAQALPTSISFSSFAGCVVVVEKRQITDTKIIKSPSGKPTAICPN